MPSNKNAIIRYMFIDAMLSNRHHRYDIHDLTEKCNRQLEENGDKEVSQRCIEKDINDLERPPFCAEIERTRIDGKRCIKYKDPSFSIFKPKLTEEESNLLLEVLNTIGQFEGLANFEWLDKFKHGLGLKERPKIISFSNNPYLQNSNLIGELFNHVSNQVVIEIEYRKFTGESNKTIILHPYLLKEYNNRWYIIGANNLSGKIFNFALDRIGKIIPRPDIEYTPCKENLTERFEDIIGVTLYEEKPIEHIVFWVSEASKDYVATKPIHESQKNIKKQELELRNKYPILDDGEFFSIECIPNYELIRELCSFGKELLVLEPSTITDEISHRVSMMNDKYSELRTLASQP